MVVMLVLLVAFLFVQPVSARGHGGGGHGHGGGHGGGGWGHHGFCYKPKVWSHRGAKK